MSLQIPAIKEESAPLKERARVFHQQQNLSGGLGIFARR
jgi:hypothetical protein